jgi:hypothetical protein
MVTRPLFSADFHFMKKTSLPLTMENHPGQGETPMKNSAQRERLWVSLTLEQAINASVKLIVVICHPIKSLRLLYVLARIQWLEKTRLKKL